MPQSNFRYILNELKAKSSVLSGTGAPASSPIYAVANAPAGKTLYEQTDTDPRKLWFKAANGAWLEVGIGGGGAGGSDWGGAWSMTPPLTPAPLPLDWTAGEATGAGVTLLAMTNSYQTGTYTVVGSVSSPAGRTAGAAPTGVLTGTSAKVSVTEGTTNFDLDVTSLPTLTGDNTKGVGMRLGVFNTAMQPVFQVTLWKTGAGTHSYVATQGPSSTTVHAEVDVATPMTSARIEMNADTGTATFYKNGVAVGTASFSPAQYIPALFGLEAQNLNAGDAGQTMVANFTLTTAGETALPVGAAEGKEYLVTGAGNWNGVSAKVGDVVQFVDGTTTIAVTTKLKPGVFKWDIPSNTSYLALEPVTASGAGFTGTGPYTMTATAQTAALASAEGIPVPTFETYSSANVMQASLVWPDFSGTHNVSLLGFMLYNSAASIDDALKAVGLKAGSPAVPVWAAMANYSASGDNANIIIIENSAVMIDANGVPNYPPSAGGEVVMEYEATQGEVYLRYNGDMERMISFVTAPEAQTFKLAIVAHHSSASVDTEPVVFTFDEGTQGFRRSVVALPSEAEPGNVVQVVSSGLYQGAALPVGLFAVIDDEAGNLTHINPTEPPAPRLLTYLTGTPLDGFGNNGDLAYVESEGRLYGPKTAGSWGGSDPIMMSGESQYEVAVSYGVVKNAEPPAVEWTAASKQHSAGFRIEYAPAAGGWNFGLTDIFGYDPVRVEVNGELVVVQIGQGGGPVTSSLTRSQLTGTEWLFMVDLFSRNAIVANSHGERFQGVINYSPVDTTFKATLANLSGTGTLLATWQPNGNSVSARFPTYPGFFQADGPRPFKQISERPVSVRWIDLALYGTWGASAGGTRYVKEGDRIFVEVNATDGTTNQLLTMPPGVRPAGDKYISGHALTEAGGSLPLLLHLNASTGVMSVVEPDDVSSGTHTICAEFSFRLVNY